jgi:hypothetical protein
VIAFGGHDPNHGSTGSRNSDERVGNRYLGPVVEICGWIQGREFDYAVTVCDAANNEVCPTFPGCTKRVHWSFEDPATVKGSNEEWMKAFRRIGDHIQERVMAFVGEQAGSSYAGGAEGGTPKAD